MLDEFFKLEYQINEDSRPRVNKFYLINPPEEEEEVKKEVKKGVSGL